MSKESTYNAIHYIAEAYLSSIEQLANTMKAEETYSRKASQTNQNNRNIFLQIFGKSLYKKYESHGNMDTYAPVAVSALNLNYNDFYAIFKNWIADEETQEKYTKKLIETLRKEYARYGFSTGYNGMIMSNLVFQTFDELCKFISLIYKTVTKLCKGAPENILNWKLLINKFKSYIH